MKLSTVLLTAVRIAITQAWNQDWGFELKWTGLDAERVVDETCKVSHITAFEMSKAKDPIFFSTNGENHPISPKLAPLNSTAGEQVLRVSFHFTLSYAQIS